MHQSNIKKWSYIPDRRKSNNHSIFILRGRRHNRTVLPKGFASGDTMSNWSINAMHMGSWGKKCCPSISFETARHQSAWIRSCSQGWSDMSGTKTWFCSPSCVGWIGCWGTFKDKTKATMLNVDTFLFKWQNPSWTRRDRSHTPETQGLQPAAQSAAAGDSRRCWNCISYLHEIT